MPAGVSLSSASSPVRIALYPLPLSPDTPPGGLSWSDSFQGRRPKDGHSRFAGIQSLGKEWLSGAAGVSVSCTCARGEADSVSWRAKGAGSMTMVVRETLMACPVPHVPLCSYPVSNRRARSRGGRAFSPYARSERRVPRSRDSRPVDAFFPEIPQGHRQPPAYGVPRRRVGSSRPVMPNVTQNHSPDLISKKTINKFVIIN